MTRKKDTIFFAAKYKKYSKIISLRTPKEARVSVRKLKKEFDAAKTNAKKLRIFRAAQLAENRAKVSLKRKTLSLEEREEFREISKIYEKAADQFGIRLSPLSPKYARMRYRQYKKHGR